jgi:hypothetical protein
MRIKTVGPRAIAALAVVLMAMAGPVTAADSDGSLAGAWSLDERSSDDPVRELQGRTGGDGLGRRIVRSVNVFGIPVGSLPLPDGEDEEEPLAPADVLGALAYVFEATYRLRIAQDAATTEILYGNSPTIVYRTPNRVAHDGWTSKAEWRDGELTIEHERVDGARLSERYWVDERADELHWTARFERPKAKPLDVKRVFYRPPPAQTPGVPLTAQL